jgi:hypothetical protein
MRALERVNAHPLHHGSRDPVAVFTLTILIVRRRGELIGKSGDDILKKIRLGELSREQ